MKDVVIDLAAMPAAGAPGDHAPTEGPAGPQPVPPVLTSAAIAAAAVALPLSVVGSLRRRCRSRR